MGLFSNCDEGDLLGRVNSFDDPIAQKTEWKPRKSGGASFKTHYAVFDRRSKVEFKKTTFMLIFPWFFILMPCIFLYIMLSNDPVKGDNSIIPLIMLILFLGIGITLFIFNSRKIIFDKQLEYYYKGFQRPDDRIAAENSRCVKLKRIHAIQIISELVRTKNSRYRSYELNLVLDDCSRVNVIDHGNLNSLRKDANALAQFLNIPVWDITI